MVEINMKQGFEIVKLFVVLAHFPWRHATQTTSCLRFYVGT